MHYIETRLHPNIHRLKDVSNCIRQCTAHGTGSLSRFAFSSASFFAVKVARSANACNKSSVEAPRVFFAVRAFWFRNFLRSLAIFCASFLCASRSSLFRFNCELMSGSLAPDAARNSVKNALTLGDEAVDPDDKPPGDAAASGLPGTAEA